MSEQKPPTVLTQDSTSTVSVPDTLTHGDVEDMLIQAWEDITLLRKQLMILRGESGDGTR